MLDDVILDPVTLEVVPQSDRRARGSRAGTHAPEERAHVTKRCVERSIFTRPMVTAAKNAAAAVWCRSGIGAAAAHRPSAARLPTAAHGARHPGLGLTAQRAGRGR